MMVKIIQRWWRRILDHKNKIITIQKCVRGYLFRMSVYEFIANNQDTTRRIAKLESVLCRSLYRDFMNRLREKGKDKYNIDNFEKVNNNTNNLNL